MMSKRSSRFNMFRVAVWAAFALQIGVQASMENPSDYSEFTNVDSYKPAYPAATDQSLYPEFSWERVPRFIVMRSGEWISDDAVERVSTNCFIVFQEKYNRQGFEYTEDGTKSLAARLKAVNPEIKNLFYWNSRVFWSSYRTDEFVYENDYIANPDDSHKLYDHDMPGMSHWWLQSIIDWIGDDDNMDGVFVDAIGKYYGDGSIFDDDGYPDGDYLAKLCTLKEAMPDKLVVFNGINNPSPNGGRHYLEIFEGGYRESSGTYSDDQPQAEAFACNIQLYREVAAKGKISMWRGFWDNTITGDEEPSRWGTNDVQVAEREQFYEDNCYFHLAMFLMAADKYSYFGYQGGDYAGTGENGSGAWNGNSIWDTSYIQAFQNPLGEPLGPPVQNGYLFTRSFKYLDVSVNTETYETTFNWKDPATVDANLMVNMTAPVSGICLDRGDTVSLEASATDSDATIDRVEFYKGATKLGEDSTAPYSYTWERVPAGQHAITAVAYDTDGHSTNSLAIYINAEDVAPLSLDPIDVITVAAADPIDAGNTSGDVIVRERDVDNSLLNRHISAFINVDLSSMASFEPAAGDYAELSIKLQGRLNSTATSALRVGQVTGGAWNASSLPSYNWATASGSSAGPGSQIREVVLISDVATAALDQTYTVDITDIVDAWVNGGESNFGLGIYLDSVNQGAGFGEVQLVGSWRESDVVADNQPPLINIGFPSSGDVYLPDEDLGIYVFAADYDGAVSRVDFYQDGEWIGADTTIPFNLTFDPAEGGSYNITVVATDNEGATTSYNVSDILKYPATFGNIALSKDTEQSSTDFSGDSSRAVDGNVSGDWGDDSVTHTGNESNAWWQVDLAGEYNMGEIRLFNRSTNQDRLSDFTVSVLTTNGSVVWSESVLDYPAVSVSVDAGGAAGQIVRVELNGSNVLSLAEVEVYEASNVAVGKPATQSSTLSYQGLKEASLAVDGNTDGSFWNGSVTHTSSSGPSPAWWQVDLGEDIEVRNIGIYNRTDSNMNRLQYFTVSVVDSLGTTNWSQSFTEYPDPSTMVNVGGVAGRYVCVEQDSENVLSLAEVEVYGSFTTNTFESWIYHNYGLTGVDTFSFVDSDNDGLSNFGEYALGGNPLDSSDLGYSAGLGVQGSSNEILFVYPRRKDSQGEMSYVLEFTDNLISNDWQTGVYFEDVVTGSMDADYESVTNRIDTTDKAQEFIRLKVNLR